MAMEACAIVSQIRFEEQQTVWSPDLEHSSNEQRPTPYPGMMFMLAKEKATSTKLFEIVRKMPKGALLHCHLEAMIDPEWLLNEALTTDGIHIAASQSLHGEEARADSPIVFRYTRKLSRPDLSLWSESYKADEWIPLASAADSFPEGGRPGFVRWLRGRCSISVEESLEYHKGVDVIWEKFMSCFVILKTLLYYEPLYRKFLAKFFNQLMEDQIRYVDVRAAFLFEYRQEGSEEAEEDYVEVIRVFGDEVDKFQASEAGKGFWGARMIWTTIRSLSKRDIVKSEYNFSSCLLVLVYLASTAGQLRTPCRSTDSVGRADHSTQACINA